MKLVGRRSAGGRVCLTFRTWSPSLLFSSSGHGTGLEWSDPGMRKDNTFHRGSMDGWVLLGGRHFPVSLTAHTVPKNAPLHGWNVASFLPAARSVEKNAIHFFSPFVILLRRRRPDNENRKEKIYVPMLFALPPSLSVY